MTATPRTHYHTAAIILHWVMALAILLMLCSGLANEYLHLEKSVKYQLFQWHKGLGILLLIAIVLRIGVRLWQKPPALPATLKHWEVVAAKLGHLGLYATMVIMPLTGWLLVSSSSWGMPYTDVFGLFSWPHFPGIASNEMIHEASEETHGVVAWLLIAVLAAHIGAVIKHAVCERENLLRRMWWTKD